MILLEKSKIPGKIPGIYAGTAVQAKMRIVQGFQYAAIGTVETIVDNSLKAIVNGVRI